ncbi:hypothetical protein RFI_36174, partial [Reticulomyxa filosa]
MFQLIHICRDDDSDDYMLSCPTASRSLMDVSTQSNDVVTRNDIVFLFEAKDKKECKYLDELNQCLQNTREETIALIHSNLEPSSILESLQFKEILMNCSYRVDLWNWKLVYSIQRDGISTDSILLIKDKHSHVFGAFVDAPWINCKDKYLRVYKSCGLQNFFLRSDISSITVGTGECPCS